MAALPPPPKLLHVDAMLSAMPSKVTPEGLSRRIATAAPLVPGLLQSHFRIVLYYGKASGEDEEEDAANLWAWIKESLSAALSEHQGMAGRLRRREEGGGGCWEIKFNDCGVRMVQATAEMSMAEFLGAEHGDRMEARLAYWAEVDEKEPYYSTLFYVQLTQFQGGGYAVGITCSVLLCDPLFLGQFLGSWTRLHRAMAVQGQLTNSPMFLLPRFRRTNQRGRHLRSMELDSISDAAASAGAATLLLEVGGGPDARPCAAAVACLGEAARKLGVAKKAASPSFVVINEKSGDAEVQMVDSAGEAVIGYETREVSWVDRLGIEEMSFVDGRKPVRASCRVVSAVDGGLAVAMLPLPDGKEWNVSVTIPAI